MSEYLFGGPDFESAFRYEGMRVRIANTQFGSKEKVAAFLEVIQDALRVDGSGSTHEH